MFAYKKLAEVSEEEKPTKKDEKSRGRKLLKICKVFFTNQMTTEEVIKADLQFEEKQKEKHSVHSNKSEWMTKELFDLELAAIKQMEQIAHPLLEDVRLQAEDSRKSGKNPSLCIHSSSKTLLSTIDDFYDNLDHCSEKDNHPNDLKDTTYACNEKLVSHFTNVANGVREFFKHCIENL